MVRRLLAALALIFLVSPLMAREVQLGELTLMVDLPPSVELGSKDPKFPVWPLWQGRDIAGYLFLTDDLVNIPGFSGTPVDLLVAMDSQGGYIDVRVVRQNEPVFVDGLGPEPLLAFLKQYKGKSIHSNIKVAVPHEQKDRQISTNTYIDGVSKASASVRIINETILSAALKVAREKLADQVPQEAPRVRADLMRRMSWQQLLDAGYVKRLRLTNRMVEAAFAGTSFADVDEDATAHPDAVFIDLYFAQVNVPSIGANLLDDDSWRRLGAKLQENDEAIIVMADGANSFTGEGFVPGSVPDRLGINQGKFPINLRNQVLDLGLRSGVPAFSQAEIYRIDRRSGFNPAAPWQFTFRVPRSHGYFLSETASRDFVGDYALPAELFLGPDKADERPWLAVWQGQAGTLAVLALSLAGLAVVLARPGLLTRRPGRLAWPRRLFLVYALGFIGWYAQGQLSMVTVLGLVKMIRAPGDLSFLLYDPISLLLWVYVLAAVAVWGRGAFCGWLCPFGALQELVAQAAAMVRLRPVRLSDTLQRRLARLRYAVLGALVVGTLIAPHWAERLAEVEPFKTAITLGFQRHWPYVAYAVALVLGGAVIYKGFCRFLCPLGALLSLPATLRHHAWLPRRAECGTACQICRRHCEYGAISPSGGAIRYADCVQCLDCVAILHDPARCVPLRLQQQGKSLRRPRPSTIAPSGADR